MEVFCVKDKCKNPNVPGTEHVVTTKNHRRLLKVKCAVCGITKTQFLPRPSLAKGGALARRGAQHYKIKIAYAASVFVNSTASWSSASKLLGSQALKGVTDNIKHAKWRR